MRKIIKHTVHVSKKHPIHATFLSLMLVATALFVGVISRTSHTQANPSPPILDTAPSLSGTAAVGQVMTVNPGLWVGADTYAYQWRSCDSAGNNCSDINGATSNTYTLAGSNSGNTVKAVVTASTTNPSPGSTSATSNTSSVIQAQLGDFNSDSAINVFDLGILLGKWQCGSCTLEDISSNISGQPDGIVNQYDLNYLLGLYQS